VVYCVVCGVVWCVTTSIYVHALLYALLRYAACILCRLRLCNCVVWCGAVRCVPWRVVYCVVCGVVWCVAWCLVEASSRLE